MKNKNIICNIIYSFKIRMRVNAHLVSINLIKEKYVVSIFDYLI